MVFEINIPDIGIGELEVTEILVKIEDFIESEQSLITVEGEKSTIEIPSPIKGIVKDIKIKVGDKVRTGDLIMIVEICEEIKNESEDSISNKLQNKNNLLSSSNINIIHNKSIKKENIDQSIYSSFSPLYKDEDDKEMLNSIPHATPLIRRLAREFGLNLKNVKGTGRKGRIIREDVQKYIRDTINFYELTLSSSYNTNMLSKKHFSFQELDFKKFGDIEEIELTRIQKISGSNLHRNWMIIPHVTQFDKADITELEKFRKEQNLEAKNNNINVKITLLVFIIKAVTKALEVCPRFNSSLSNDGNKLIIKKYINIGVAVNTPNGIVVPVFKNINKKGIIELSNELSESFKLARMGKIALSQMQGGCFTISNLGNIGGTAFTPIINSPEVAILGISKSEMKLIWNGNEFISRLILPLSLSYDHRIIDGVDGAKFIGFIKNIMSDIRRLIM